MSSNNSETWGGWGDGIIIRNIDDGARWLRQFSGWNQMALADAANLGHTSASADDFRALDDGSNTKSGRYRVLVRRGGRPVGPS